MEQLAEAAGGGLDPLRFCAIMSKDPETANGGLRVFSYRRDDGTLLDSAGMDVKPHLLSAFIIIFILKTLTPRLKVLIQYQYKMRKRSADRCKEKTPMACMP